MTHRMKRLMGYTLQAVLVRYKYQPSEHIAFGVLCVG